MSDIPSPRKIKGLAKKEHVRITLEEPAGISEAERAKLADITVSNPINLDTVGNKVGYITVTLPIDLDALAIAVGLNTAKVSNVNTDLALGAVTGISVEIVSSDGNNVTLDAATITDAGLMSAADKVKLDGL